MRRMRKELLMLLTLTLSFTLVDSHRVKTTNICESIKVNKQKCNVNDNHMFFENYECGGGGTYISVTDIDVGTNELHLKLNETYSVNVSYYPENCSYSLRYCDFKSDNEGIATVNTSGVVEPRCYGSTTIYVYLRSNHDIYKTINVFVDSEMEEYYNDIEYNHFDDSIEVNGDLIDNTNCDLFEEVGSNDLINYSCSFNLENNEVYFNASLKAINKISVSFKIDVEIAEDKNGFIDAVLTIRDKMYRFSDYVGKYLNYNYSTNDSEYIVLQKNSFGSTIANMVLEKCISVIMGAIYVTIQYAMMIVSLINYEYNKNLDNSSEGVKTGYYIYNQCACKEYENNEYHNAGSYRFGFFNVSEKGCGAVAIYNMLINMGKPNDFSMIISLLERNNCLILGGLCGANPLKIHRIFDILNITYKCFITDDAIFKCLKEKYKEYVIMCRWNKDPLINGAHYFYSFKDEKNYSIYNSNTEMEIVSIPYFRNYCYSKYNSNILTFVIKGDSYE